RDGMGAVGGQKGKEQRGRERSRVSTLTELLAEHTRCSGDAVEHLQRVVAEWQLLADMSFADFLLWVPLSLSEVPTPGMSEEPTQGMSEKPTPSGGGFSVRTPPGGGSSVRSLFDAATAA